MLKINSEDLKALESILDYISVEPRLELIYYLIKEGEYLLKEAEAKYILRISKYNDIPILALYINDKLYTKKLNSSSQFSFYETTEKIIDAEIEIFNKNKRISDLRDKINNLIDIAN